MYKYIVRKLSYVQIYTVELLKIIRTQSSILGTVKEVFENNTGTIAVVLIST